jgi:hypothetical protein
MATMRAVMLTKKGGPGALARADLPMPEPGLGEVRAKVRATGVGAPGITMRRGSLLAKGKGSLTYLLDDYPQYRIFQEHGGSSPPLELPSPKYFKCSCFRPFLRPGDLISPVNK